MRSFRIFRPQLGYLAAAVLAAQSVTVQAQLEEVIVTAQLRTESLQDVPISMVAMSGDTINELGLNNMEEFTANLPAVTIMNGPIGNLLFIRGVGTAGINAGIEQSLRCSRTASIWGASSCPGHLLWIWIASNYCVDHRVSCSVKTPSAAR